MLLLKTFEKRKRRVRAKIAKVNNGRHRLSVYRSNKNIYAQLVDLGGSVITSYSSLLLDEADISGMSGVDKARLVGKKLAESCAKLGIDSFVFDKGGYSYSGRVKALSESCREFGIKF